MNSMRNHFGETLRASLKRRYGRVPSAAVVAREFNLRSTDSVVVSNETARRWIRGVSIPDANRLATISCWLDIDYNTAFAQPLHVPQQAAGQLATNPCDEFCQQFHLLDKTAQELLLKLLNTYSSVFQQNNLTTTVEQNFVSSL